MERIALADGTATVHLRDMTATALDTLEIVRDLEAAGVERRHAEAYAEAMAKAANAGHGELAAKADLDKGLGELKAELKTDMANLETRLTVCFVGMAVGIVLANAGLTFALLKLLPQVAP